MKTEERIAQALSGRVPFKKVEEAIWILWECPICGSERVSWVQDMFQRGGCLNCGKIFELYDLQESGE